MRWGRTTRRYLEVAVVLGLARALLVVAQAWLLATVVAGAFLGEKTWPGCGFRWGSWWRSSRYAPVLVWGSEVSADRCSARVKSELRSALLRRAALPGRDGRTVKRPGELAALAVRGIDALDGYFGRYIPQLLLAVIVPLTVLVAVVGADWISAVIMAVTLPLIPVFMALIGWATGAHSDRQLRTLQHLSGHFLDVVSGLATLKIFGRSKAQTRTIREVTDSYRRTTMTTLRLTFLSSLALELLASVSVALVAVAIGLRLLDGHLQLRSALFVLVLAPEAYLPLRQLGAEYHASAEGLSAAQQVFEVLDAPLPRFGTVTRAPDPAAHGPGDRHLAGELSRTGRSRPRRGEPGGRSRRGAGDHRPERMRQVHAAQGGASASSIPTPGRYGPAPSTSLRSTPTSGVSRLPGSRNGRISSRRPSWTMCAWAGPAPARATWKGPSPTPGWRGWWPAFPLVSRR